MDGDEKFFEERTNKHIELVQRAAKKIVDKYPELEPLLKQTGNHDASKFIEPERTPYIELTQKLKKLDKQDKYETPGTIKNDELNKATLHHITTNSHHPEHHLDDKKEANLDPEDRDKSVRCIDASKMPELDMAEMIADWQAMSEELKRNTTREWFNEQRDVRWHFSDEQVAFINKLIGVFGNESTT